MMPRGYAVVLMYSTSYALRAESILHRAGIETKLVPVPRHLSSNCGVCVRIVQADREAALSVLDRARMEIEGIYDLE